MEGTLLKEINQEKSDFENKEITIVDGYTFNQKLTIERIYRLFNSKYQDSDVDADGDKKYFYNVVRNPCKVTTKMIDFDTKDIKILTAAGGNSLTTWFYEKDLKQWMKEQDFGKVLNRIFEELPIFGSVVIKVINGVPHFVDLRNFIVSEPSADTLDKANSIIERHLYTPYELKKVGRKMGWNESKINEAIELHRGMKKPYIAVYERYGEVGEWKEGKEYFVYKRIFVADVGQDETDQRGGILYHSGIVFGETEINKHPYYEFHINKMSGRWLGVGIVESLFDIQVRQNEIANLSAKGSYWNALRIFQTRGTFGGQTIREFSNGHVIDGLDAEILPVNMQDPNLAFFAQETQKWNSIRDENTLSYDVVQGERLPAGTPLGSAQIAASMAQSYFDQIRENIALDVKKFLYEIVLPYFEKTNTAEHTVRLVGNDLDKIRNIVINQKANLALFDFIGKNNKIPGNKEFEMIKAGIGEKEKQDKERIINIPKEFYRDVKYKIDIVITGESKDTRTMTQVFFAALQAITADPTILQDPMKKKIFMKALENSGVNPEDIIPDEPMPTMNDMVSQMVPSKGAGGGVSAPTPMSQGQGMMAETRI
jgi:hypothetical protein